MGQLATKRQRLRERCISGIREAIVAREASYLTIASWLTIARDEELWFDDEDCDCLAHFANKYFDYSKSYVSRLIAAKQAHDDVLELPIGTKNPQTGGEFLEPPKTEAVARELAKVDGPQAKADVWVKANEGCKGSPTAARVAKIRKAMFPPSPGDNGTVPPETAKSTSGSHLKGLIATIDTVRCRIDDLKKEHRPESQSWQTALDSLDEARKAFARLAR